MAINGWGTDAPVTEQTTPAKITGWGDSTSKKEEPSYASRAGSEISNAVEGSARMLGGMPGYIASGYRGMLDTALGHTDTQIQQGMEDSAKLIDPSTYFPSQDRDQNFKELMTSALKQAGEFGEISVATRRELQKALGESLQRADKVATGENIKGGSMDLPEAIPHSILGRTAGELAMNFAPIPGMKGIERALKSKPPVDLTPPPDTASKAGYTPFEQTIQTSKEGQASGRLQSLLDRDPNQMPSDLFGTDQPSAIPPGIRSPYNLTQQQQDAGTKSIARADRESGEVLDPKAQQPDLFETPSEKLARLTQEGEVGARDKEAKEFIPQDRDGNAPGVYPETQPRGEFQSREPAQIPPVVQHPARELEFAGKADPTTYTYGPDRVLNKDGTAVNPKPGEKSNSSAARVTMSDATPIDHSVIEDGKKRLALMDKSGFTQLIPTSVAWNLRDHNRFLELKTAERWKRNELSYRKTWQWDPIEIKYSTADGKAVVTNGNHRTALNVKYGVPETAARVTVTDQPLTGTEAKTGVVVGKGELPNGETHPENIGIQGRPLNPGKGPTEAQANKGFQKLTIDDRKAMSGTARMMFDQLEKDGFSQIQTRNDGTRFIQAPVRLVLKHLGNTIDFAKSPFVNQFLKGLAKQLSETNALRQTPVTFEFDNHSSWIGGDRFAGKYYPIGDVMAIAKGSWGNPLTIMHEAVHAALVHEQYVNPDSPFSKSVRALYTWAIKDLKGDIEAIQKSTTGEQALSNSARNPNYNSYTYGFNNEREFLAEITTPEFIQVLDSMKLKQSQVDYLHSLLPKKSRPRINTYWDAIKTFVTNMLGRPYSETSMLDQLLRVTTHGLDTAGQVPKADTLPKINKLLEMGKWDAQTKATKEGPKGLVSSLRQFQSLADKPLKEVMDSFHPDSVEDISETFKVQAYAQIDRVNSLLAEGYKGAGSLIKWTVDKLTTIDRTRDVAIEAALKGDKYEPGKLRGFDRRLWGDDGALTLWRKLRGTDDGPAQLRSMLTEWLSAHREQRDPIFQTDKQRQIYDTVQKQFTKVLDYVNESRVKAGLDKIAPLKAYFPSLVMGDYRVLVRDADGKTVHYSGYSNIYEAKKFVQLLKAEGLENLDIKDPYHIQPDKYKMGDLSAFEESMRILGADDPAAQAIQKVYQEVSSKRGAGSHGVKKEFVSGFMGSEAGETGVRRGEQAIEAYLKKMYTYGSNLEKAGVRAEIAGLPSELRAKLPNSVDYANDYIEHSRGADLKQWAHGIDAFTEFLSKKAGLGESGARKAISNMTSLMGVMWLFTEKFATTQIPQHLNAMAKMTQLAGRGEFGNPVAAYFGGLKNAISPDATALVAVNFALRNGYLSPVVAELVHTKLAETSMTDSVRDITRWTLGKIEQEVVRMPTFLMFEKGLRGEHYDPKVGKSSDIQRFEEAAALTDHYMVHYSQTSKPMIYNKLGAVLGGSAAPLKQYAHNTYGQFFEYAKGATDGEITPLATFMVTQALVAGLKGTILVGEATAIITAINWFNQQRGKGGDPWPTPEELFLTSGISDWLIYGLTSKLTGQDMTASVGATPLNQMLTLPVAAFTVNMGETAYNYITKSLTGTDTISDRMRMALTFTPSALHGKIEEYFTEPGHPVPNAFDAQGRGNYVRSERDWNMAKLGFGRSIAESKANALARSAKEDLLYHDAVKLKLLDAISDMVKSKKQIDPDIMKAYVKEGGNPATLSSDIIARAKQQQLDYITRQQMGKSMTPERARKLQILQPSAAQMPQRINGWN